MTATHADELARHFRDDSSSVQLAKDLRRQIAALMIVANVPDATQDRILALVHAATVAELFDLYSEVAEALDLPPTGLAPEGSMQKARVLADIAGGVPEDYLHLVPILRHVEAIMLNDAPTNRECAKLRSLIEQCLGGD